MKGYVARKGDRYYAVVYEGVDPITGRERRRWYPAGSDRPTAEALAHRLADEHRSGGTRQRSSLTVAVYLTQRWLPTKQSQLRPSTWDGYRRNIDLHVVPNIGRIPLRQLRPDHLERLYGQLLTDGRANGTGGLDNKTVLEVHMILRRALDDATRRGLLIFNPAQLAHAPNVARSPVPAPGPGTPSNFEPSWTSRSSTGSTPRSGSPPTPGCAEASSSDSGGETSTSPAPTCPSAAR